MREVLRVADDGLIDHSSVSDSNRILSSPCNSYPGSHRLGRWAIEPREREAVLKAAAAQGVPSDSVAGKMLTAG